MPKPKLDDATLIRFPAGTLERIDAVAGKHRRAQWIRSLVDAALDRAEPRQPKAAGKVAVSARAREVSSAPVPAPSPPKPVPDAEKPSSPAPASAPAPSKTSSAAPSPPKPVAKVDKRKLGRMPDGSYMTAHPCHTPWRAMHDKSPKTGIAIYPPWRGASGFLAFIDDMGCPEPGQVLLRRDVTQAWSPDNCAWGSKREANRNRTCVERYAIHGMSKTIEEWAKYSGIPYHTLRARFYNPRWTLERAISEPVRPGPGRPRQPRGMTLLQ